MRYLVYFIVSLFLLAILILIGKLLPFIKTILIFLSKIISPFLIAGLIAYLLHPLVNKLASWKISRRLSLAIIYLLFFGGGSFLIYYFSPILMAELSELTERVPIVFQQYDDFIQSIYSRIAFLPENLQNQIETVIFKLESLLTNKLGTYFTDFTRIFEVVIICLIIPVITFYLLKDLEIITRFFQKFIPEKSQDKLKKMLKLIDTHLGNYIRGQLIVSAFVTLSTYIIFDLFNLKYAFLLAIIIGITNIIPYFGPLIGAIPAIIVAAIVSKKLIVIVIIIIFAIQLIENTFISPIVLSKSTNMHPIAIIFALLVGGEFGGIIGLILSVPLMTICYAFIKEYWKDKTVV